MARAVQGLQRDDFVMSASSEEANWRTQEGVWLFGVRHLSAAGAWHVTRFLDEIKPDLVLVEGPSDADELIPHIVKRGVKPPLAVLCYTAEAPVSSILYPLAVYSPEYRAMLWAAARKKPCRFIDLPSGIKTTLYHFEDQHEVRLRKTSHEAWAAGAENHLPDEVKRWAEYRRFSGKLYDEAARLAGEDDYDAFWERYFEHNLETSAYLNSVALHSAEMRRMTEARQWEADPVSGAVNAVRESYMKRGILESIREGYEPGKIAVICGAYHMTGLMGNEAVTDAELSALPRAETRMTLMPYSYYKMSAFSGYGAGNHAPYYYEMMWRLMEQGNLPALPAAYLSRLSGIFRQKHGYSSTATVIDAVRLARSLQYMHEGLLPTLKDLHDSAVAAMANGQLEGAAEAFASLDVGITIGELPEGVSQTPVQDDMNRQLKKLRLEKFKTVVAQDLTLDLRENRRVQSEVSAFLDLDRSVFLRRLELLNIQFARPAQVRQDSASWAERWTLCWTPEAEIQTVEAVLLGDTIEAAASYKLKEMLEQSADVAEVARLTRLTCDCRLPESAFDAIRKLQSLAAASDNFSAVAGAAREMSFLIQYGSIRKYDTKPILPILEQLFIKASLLMCPCASCSDDAAREMMVHMTQLHHITQEHDETVNDALWLRQLDLLAFSNEKNAMLCGFAFSLLLERGQAGEEQMLTEVSRRLSPGNTAEAGAGWFDGLSRRNRYLLLSRPALWKQLDFYLQALEDEEFKRALICLRRALANFQAQEKAGICEILADLWHVDAGSAAEILSDKLTEQEEDALAALNDFDFGDF